MTGPAGDVPVPVRPLTAAEQLHDRPGDRAAAAQDPEWSLNAATAGFRLPVREVWRARELIGFFALRDLRVRYKQAVLGVAWVVLQPLITVVAFTLVFDRLANVSSQGLPYPVFALAGLLGWTYVSQCIGRGSEVLVANPSMITKVYFPRLIAPIASLVPPMVDAAVGLAALAVLCVVYETAPGPQLALLPVWVVLLAVTALGPICLLAALNVRFRDVRQIVPTALQALLFLSPVGYSSASLDGAARFVYALNPVVAPLEFGRFVLVDAPWPGTSFFISTTVGLVLTAVGVLVFQRASRSFADVI